MENIVCLLFNQMKQTYHPVIYRWSPMPSDDLPTAKRYKSAAHHTEGFKDCDAAISHAKEMQPNEKYQFLDRVFVWDGDDIPLDVRWFDVENRIIL